MEHVGHETAKRIVGGTMGLLAAVIFAWVALVGLSGCGQRGVYVLTKVTEHYDVAHKDDREKPFGEEFREESPGREPLETTVFSRDDAGNLTQRTYTQFWGGVIRIVYSYDEYGNRMSTDILELDSNAVDTRGSGVDYKIEADEAGRCIKKAGESYASDEDYSYRSMAALSYGDAGLIATLSSNYEVNDGVKNEKQEARLDYDERGYLVSSKVMRCESATDKLRELWDDPDASLSDYWISAVYDQDWDSSFDWKFDSNGFPVSLVETKRHLRRVVEGESWFIAQDDFDGDIDEANVVTRYFETDEHGNIIRVFDEDHELLSELEYEYVENPSPMVTALNKDSLHNDSYLLNYL